MGKLRKDKVRSGSDACRFADERASDSGCHIAWRQNGSHIIGKVLEDDTGRHRGSLVIVDKREVRKGTLHSFFRMMGRLGLLALVLVSAALAAGVVG